MEIYIYIFIYITTMVFILMPKIIKSETFFFIFWFLVCVAFGSYLIIIALSSDGDIASYAANMKNDLFLASDNREFIYWHGSKYLYSMLNDPSLVFLVWNLILYSVLYKGFLLIHRGFHPGADFANMRYMFFGFLLFFPVIVGMHGMYRQLLASVFFLLAIGYVSNYKFLRGYIYVFLAIFIHNVVALFLPLLLFMRRELRYKITSVVMMAIMPFALIFVEKSNDPLLSRTVYNIGNSIHYLYFFVFFCIFLIVLLIEKNKVKANNRVLNYVFTVFTIYTIAVFSLDSSLNAERIAFVSLILIYPIGVYYVDKSFSNKVAIKAIYFHALLAPLILHYDTSINI